MYDLKVKDTIFESIKHVDENGCEFWYSRELQNVLEYAQWRRFEQVIEKSKESCKNSNYVILDHFANVGKMVNIGSKTTRKKTRTIRKIK